MRWSPVALGSLAYGIVLLLLGLSLSILNKFYPENYTRGLVANFFSFYKYGLGLFFMIELELARLYERRWWSQRNPDGIAYCHVGSFYLRMGILIFGSVAVVQHFMRGFIEFGETTWEWSKEPLIAFYILLQMALIFNFSITRMPLQSNLEAFGFMHLLVVNILKWVGSARDEITHLKHAQKHDSHGAAHAGAHGAVTPAVAGPGGAHAEHLVADAHSAEGPDVKSADEKAFGEYAAVVGAFNTEFLIAAAGILLIVWLNINAVVAVDRRWKSAVEGHVRRKKTIRITIGRTFIGLFIGLALSVFLAVGVVVHRYYLDAGRGRTKWVMEFTNAGAYTAMLGACIVGMLVMRKSLDGKWDMKADGAKDELLDKVLLIIGVTAEVVYCGTAIVGALASPDLRHKILTSIGYLLRLAQSAIQAHFILDLTGAVTCRRPGERTPGRQTILFLLWANLSLFFYYVVQTIHSVFVSTITGLLPSPYRTIIALALPFVLFYRFHSSAVLAELYKHHCSEPKEGGHGGGHGGVVEGRQEHHGLHDHPAPTGNTGGGGQPPQHQLHYGTQF